MKRAGAKQTMNEAELMRVLAEEPEGVEYGSPVHQDKVFIIMWQSSKSGGTYTELRKSERGKNRFLQGLHFSGVSLSEVYVIEQSKQWVPVKKTKTKKEGLRPNGRVEDIISTRRGRNHPRLH